MNNFPQLTPQKSGIDITINVTPHENRQGAILTFNVGPTSYNIFVPWDFLPAIAKLCSDASDKRPRIALPVSQ